MELRPVFDLPPITAEVTEHVAFLEHGAPASRLQAPVGFARGTEEVPHRWAPTSVVALAA